LVSDPTVYLIPRYNGALLYLDWKNA
jgi:hypothetical protein